MEPVASHFQEHEKLGQALVQGLRSGGVPVFEGGSLQMDLTQTSYSTIPSIDIELGDRASDHSEEACIRYAESLKAGVDLFFTP
jgi:N-acetylmuramoyl-L-alanine amidase